MKISLRGHYAVLALACLVPRNGSEERLRIEDIVRRHPIPEPFLLQIFQDLKKAGLVRSKRGAKGGYSLARDPGSVTLTAIIESVEGPILPNPTEGKSNANGKTGPDPLEELWGEVRTGIQAVGDRHTLADIARKIETKDSEMYYI